MLSIAARFIRSFREKDLPRLSRGWRLTPAPGTDLAVRVGLTSQLRQAEAELLSVFQRDRFVSAVVQVGDAADDREAETRAGQRPRIRRPVKAVKNMRQVFGRNSWSFVADFDRSAGRRDKDATLRRTPLQRVVDEVADRPFQRVRVTADQ